MFTGYAVLTPRGRIAIDSSGNSDKALAVYKTRREAEEMRDSGETVTKVAIWFVTL